MSGPCVLPLPKLNRRQLTRQFDIQQPINSEVTALDVSSHGAHVLVGFGNGLVVCYDMTGAFIRSHDIVAHIQAKGLHTNLLMSLKITEDCRYCFAGVKKGSSEMIAIELGQLPVWDTLPNTRKLTGSIADFVVCHTHQDPKLRGLGDAIMVRMVEGDISDKVATEYRLACGLGIKNVHIWQFVPSTIAGQQPTWTCLYDFATNGNTIECMKLRYGGSQVLSKSSDMNVRLWTLNVAPEGAAGIDGNAKPTYEDVPNTQDTRLILNSFAFGGTYDLAVVRLDADKANNKDSFEMPGRAIEDDHGQRRKRMMRQIGEVIGTEDGRHVLVLCTDGGVLYFTCRPSAVADVPFEGELLECQSLVRDLDADCVWSLKSVGSTSEVVLLRAVSTYSPDGPSQISIAITPITAMDELHELAGNAGTIELASTAQYFYFDSESCNSIVSRSVCNTAGAVETSPRAKPPRPPAQNLQPIPLAATGPPINRRPATPSTPNVEQSKRRADSSQRFGSESPRLGALARSPGLGGMTTPATQQISSKSSGISPMHESRIASTPKKTAIGDDFAKEPSKKSRLNSSTQEVESDEHDMPATVVVREKLSVDSLPRIPVGIESHTVMPRTIASPHIERIWDQFVALRDDWTKSLGAFSEGIGSMPRHQSAVSRRLSGCAAEQQRLKNQFVVEICRVITYLMSRSLQLDSSMDVIPSQLPRTSIVDVVTQYKLLAKELVQRQKLEIQCAANFDRLCSASSLVLGEMDEDTQSPSTCLSVSLSFDSHQMFSSAIQLHERVLSLLHSSSPALS